MNHSLFFSWTFAKKQITTKKILLNFGPQHPAAHGVLRLILQLEGEIIQRADVHIGLLHRGTEFLAETKYYEKTLPYMDRLDYVSMMTQEHAFCLCIEYLENNFNISENINFLRILFDELTRLLNHLLAIACHALDIGSMSSIFWCFEEREKIMEFYERVSGARMHAAFHRPVTIFEYFIDKQLLLDILKFIQDCFTTLNEVHNVLTYNKIWKQRLLNIGTITVADCYDWGLTGVMVRSVGTKHDLRLGRLNSYSGYNKLSFNSYIGVNGDCYDRFLIRMCEMGESLKLANMTAQALSATKTTQLNKIQNINPLTTIYTKKLTKDEYTSMEDLIDHFIRWQQGYVFTSQFAETFIESPKGEFGVSLLSDSTSYPRRCKIRSPSYHNLQFLPKLTKGHYLADLAALIGTIDIVFGEIDR